MKVASDFFRLVFDSCSYTYSYTPNTYNVYIVGVFDGISFLLIPSSYIDVPRPTNKIENAKKIRSIMKSHLALIYALMLVWNSDASLSSNELVFKFIL